MIMFGIFNYKKHLKNELEHFECSVIGKISHEEAESRKIYERNSEETFLRLSKIYQALLEAYQLETGKFIEMQDQKIVLLDKKIILLEDSLAKIEEQLSINENERYRIKKEAEFRNSRSQE